MTDLTGFGGLVLLLLAIALTVVLDVADGPVGWRRAAAERRYLTGATLLLVLLAAIGTGARIVG
jgi:hypothetical protein